MIKAFLGKYLERSLRNLKVTSKVTVVSSWSVRLHSSIEWENSKTLELLKVCWWKERPKSRDVACDASEQEARHVFWDGETRMAVSRDWITVILLSKCSTNKQPIIRCCLTWLIGVWDTAGYTCTWSAMWLYMKYGSRLGDMPESILCI